MRVIKCLLITLLILVGNGAIQFSLPQAFGQSEKESPQKIYEKANEFFKSQNWKDALVLYQQLTTKYEKDSFVRGKAKDIDDKITQCQNKLGIVNDITRIFRGKAKLDKKSTGEKVIKLFYDFSNEDELEDFKNVSADEIKIVNKTLEVSGRSEYFFCNLQDVIFMDELSLECSVMIVPPTDQEAEIAIFYDSEKVTGYLFGLRYKETMDLPHAMCNCIRMQCGTDIMKTRNLCISPKPIIEPGKTYQLKIVAQKGDISFYINNELIKKVTEKTYTQGLLRFGGWASRVQYDNIKIEGIVNPRWLDKAFSKATTEALVKKDAAKQKTDISKVDMDLSAENKKILADISNDIIDNYKRGKVEIDSLSIVQSTSIRDLYKSIKTAITFFDDVIKQSPNFSAAYYERGECYRALGEKQNALADFNKAIETFPDFYEAYIQRADIYRGLSKFQEAIDDYEKCISINPKYSYGYSGRGYLHFIMGERDKAMVDINKALELNNSNSDAIEYKRNLQHVIKGPLWPVSYTKESDHYQIMTDINQDKCDSYAEQLETMNKYYAEMFNYKEVIPRKNRVLIFNTHEGYQAYSELTTNDSSEYTLGYYHPHYKELLVFEEVNKEADVLHVLYHEGFHMFIHQIIGTAPIWFNEGFAEYFNGTGLSRQGNKLAITRKGAPIARLKTIQSAVEEGAAVSFEQIMNESQKEFYNDGSIRYAQAWSMIHFFLHYQQGVYKKLLTDYIKLLKEGKSQLQAFEEIFKKQDLGKMQKEWVKYVKGLKEK